MYTRVIEATEEYEEGVRALFASYDLAPRDDVWARAFSPDAPPGFHGAPFAAVAEEGDAVLAFVVARPQRLFHQGSTYSTQILYDFVVAPGDDAQTAGRQLLETVCQRASLNFAAGWSSAATEVLRQASWKHIANLPRLRLNPPSRTGKQGGPDLPPSLEPSEDPTQIQSAMAAEGMIFFERPRGVDRYQSNTTGDATHLVFPLEMLDEFSSPGAFVRLRQVQSSEPGRTEWHVVDMRGASLHLPEAAKFLSNFAAQTGQPVYLSCLNRALETLAQEQGAEVLRPRWMLFCRLGDLSLRDLIVTLTIQSPWNLFPADFDLDLE